MWLQASTWSWLWWHKEHSWARWRCTGAGGWGMIEIMASAPWRRIGVRLQPVLQKEYFGLACSELATVLWCQKHSIWNWISCKLNFVLSFTSWSAHREPNFLTGLFSRQLVTHKHRQLGCSRCYPYFCKMCCVIADSTSRTGPQKRFFKESLAEICLSLWSDVRETARPEYSTFRRCCTYGQEWPCLLKLSKCFAVVLVFFLFFF